MFWVARIGSPAATFPTIGTDTVASFPTTFIALVFKSPLSIYPFSASLHMYWCADEVDLNPSAAQISLTEGG